ncbi:hypothetical protein BC829DRAFT_390189 [Chytridium lagenaria]|nr:hypothetical protein BC829DRAFT_390189 [Chytridium lagenaria]
MIAGLSSLPTDSEPCASDRPVITFANRGLGESELSRGEKRCCEQKIELNHAFDLFGHSMEVLLLDNSSQTPRSPSAVSSLLHTMTFNLDDRFKEEYPEKFKSICENYLKGKRPVNVIIAQAIATSTYDSLAKPSQYPLTTSRPISHSLPLPVLIITSIPKALYLRMENVGHLAMAYSGMRSRIVDGFLVKAEGDGGM